VTQSFATESKPYAILVDKKTNQLFVAQYVDGALEVVKTYHTTVGKVVGDKQVEGDLKTPEGIYTFQSLSRPPQLKPKFGVMAFYLNYPNTFDLLAGQTGSNIMLHATDDPTRLKQKFDSEGCIVVENKEIEEIAPFIRLGLTPILVFAELTQDFMKGAQNSDIKGFFDGWIRAWEGKDIDAYTASYHSDFSAQGMNKKQWRAYKANLNDRYASIKIGPEAVKFYRHPKYSMITFTQNYHSRLKSGGVGHKSRGTKILYVAEESGIPKIIAESYTTLMW